MIFCRLLNNIVEYFSTHKLLIFTLLISLLNFLHCINNGVFTLEDYDINSYWIIALVFIIGIIVGAKSTGRTYYTSKILSCDLVESKRTYWFDKNWVRVVSSCSGLISLVICVIILAVYCPKNSIDIDYLGAITGIISLAVAIFVGTQIYQSFNLKKDIDEQNKKLLADSKESFSSSISMLKEQICRIQKESNGKFDAIKSYIDGKIQKERDRNFLIEEMRIAQEYSKRGEFDDAFRFYCGTARDAYNQKEHTIMDIALFNAETIMDSYGESFEPRKAKGFYKSIEDVFGEIGTSQAVGLKEFAKRIYNSDFSNNVSVNSEQQ